MANTPIAPPKKKTFLEELAKTGNISHACRVAKIDRSTVFRFRKEDDSFRAEFEDALEQAADDLEAEARRRAYEGVKKPIYQSGKRVGFVQEYSDTLLIFLLKGAKPERYKDRHEHSGPNNGAIPVSVTGAIDKIYGNSSSKAK